MFMPRFSVRPRSGGAIRVDRAPSNSRALMIPALHFAGGSTKTPHRGHMDADLDTLSREQLIIELKRLRQAIREHRDSTGHNLCWHQPALWSLLPDRMDPAVAVPAWPQFMRGCIRYRQSLDEQAPGAPRVNTEFKQDGDA
jgi:hypothetical protein